MRSTPQLRLQILFARTRLLPGPKEITPASSTKNKVLVTGTAAPGRELLLL